MDKQLQEFINGIGMIAETALLFYRSTLSAKATQNVGSFLYILREGFCNDAT